jgi:hypothetical protein
MSKSRAPVIQYNLCVYIDRSAIHETSAPKISPAIHYTSSVRKDMQLWFACQKSSSRLTKFTVNSIHISKSIYYENIFHN